MVSVILGSSYHADVCLSLICLCVWLFSVFMQHIFPCGSVVYIPTVCHPSYFPVVCLLCSDYSIWWIKCANADVAAFYDESYEVSDNFFL